MRDLLKRPYWDFGSELARSTSFLMVLLVSSSTSMSFQLCSTVSRCFVSLRSKVLYIASR